MALAKKDIEMLDRHIKEKLPHWLEAIRYDRDLELRERMIRVEEELKNQRELMMLGFAQVEKRSEQVDKRFDEIQKHLFQFMIWSFGLTISAAGIIIAVLKS